MRGVVGGETFTGYEISGAVERTDASEEQPVGVFNFEFVPFFVVGGSVQLVYSGDGIEAGRVFGFDESGFRFRHVVFRHVAAGNEIARGIKFRDTDVVFAEGGFESDGIADVERGISVEVMAIFQKEDAVKVRVGSLSVLLREVVGSAEIIVDVEGGLERGFGGVEGDYVAFAVMRGEQDFSLAEGSCFPGGAFEGEV